MVEVLRYPYGIFTPPISELPWHMFGAKKSLQVEGVRHLCHEDPWDIDLCLYMARRSKIIDLFERYSTYRYHEALKGYDAGKCSLEELKIYLKLLKHMHIPHIPYITWIYGHKLDDAAERIGISAEKAREIWTKCRAD